MTQLRKRVLDELERRNYSKATADAYISAIWRFTKYFHRSPDQLGPVQVRQYQLHLVQECKLHPRTVMVQTAALRFLFLKVLKRRFSRDDLPLPRTLRRQIPVVLSRDEVARLIAAAGNLRHRTILMTLYSTGMRRSELCHLRPEDIDKEQRTMTLAAEEFIRRFLLHVLPKGFMRIRQFGWMANRCRRQRAAQCRALLGAEEPPSSSSPTGADPPRRRCPFCGGNIEVVEVIVPREFSRRRPCRRRELDTS